MQQSIVEQARSAGLRYVSDSQPGISRRSERGGFAYFTPTGKRIRAKDEIARIASLAVPPAYTDVWICKLPNGHIQATGRDARGRKQYRYHPKWSQARNATKFHRMQAFADALPRIRARVDADLSKPGLTKEKVLAAVVALLETTLIRVGNEEYARDNDSYGLTTLRNRHAVVRGAKLRFEFKGKSGLMHRVSLTDRRLARIVSRCQELPDQHLFAYVGDDGEATPIGSNDVNEYLRDISGDDFTAKDYRTWVATLTCFESLERCEPATERERKTIVKGVVDACAHRLRNTATVCRKSYIYPALLDHYIDEGAFTMRSARGGHRGLRASERRLLSFLKQQERQQRRRKTTTLVKN